MRERLSREKSVERFAGNGEIRRDRIARDGFVELGIERDGVFGINKLRIAIVDPDRIGFVAEQSFATDVFAKPILVSGLDRLNHLVPVRVVFREDLKWLAILPEEGVERLFRLDQAVGSDRAELLLIESSESPQAGHEKRCHNQKQKRDLGLDFHFLVTTSRASFQRRGSSPYQTAFSIYLFA